MRVGFKGLHRRIGTLHNRFLTSSASFRPALLAAFAVGLLTLSAPCRAFAAPADFDADGRSDIVLAAIGGDGALSFSAFNVTAGQQSALPSLGQVGNQVVLAPWQQSGIPVVGVVSAMPDGTVNWSIPSSNTTMTRALGRAGDTAISGADLNGDGIADAAVVRKNGRSLAWEVSLGLFGNVATVNQYTFGLASEIPLYVHTSKGDRLATLAVSSRGVASMRIFDLKTGKASKTKLSHVPPSVRPLPIFLGAKRSPALAYIVTKGKTTVVTYQSLLTRSTVGTAVINGTGTALVGDFTTSPGEEVAIYNDGKLLIYDRATRKVVEHVVPEGIAIDEININVVARATSPAPTPLPNPTPTPRNSTGGGDNNPGSPTTPIEPTPNPDPKLAQVCSTYSTIAPKEMLIKSEASNHIGAHDPRTSGYTVVCGTNCPANTSYVQIFYANGAFAGAVAKYGLFSGNGQPRLYGAVGLAPEHDAQAIARKAQTIGNGKLYLQTSPATTGPSTTCKEFNPTGRNGSL